MPILRQLSLRKRYSPSASATPRSHTAEYHLTKSQLRRLLDATPSVRDRTIMALMAGTGMRRAEVVSLDIQDLRLGENLLVVRSGKGGKCRLIPLTPALADLLQSCLDGRPAGPVFLSRFKGPLCSRQLNRIVENAGRRAGIVHPDPRKTRLTCHLFRHTFARLWKDAGGSIETLSSILGHSSQATTLDLYGREGLSDVKANYARTMKKIGI
ncbi:MAG: tyrosine-type recombinase/integrase [candidate division Zixibacteria bacterium]|jgi:integrase/recombinase XerD|nr:tyrosine-type recombinase/integrase [candidate division Zixibacteria bacterium]